MKATERDEHIMKLLAQAALVLLCCQLASAQNEEIKMVSKVKRDGEKVWIEGVPQRQGSLKCVFHFEGFPDILRTAFRFKGVDEKYLDETVFGAITGYGFRFWFSTDWASCLAYTFEEPTAIVTANILGFDCRWHEGLRGDANWVDLCERKKTLNKQAVDKAWQEIRNEIDKGNPVIIYGGDPGVDPKAGPILATGYDTKEHLVCFLPNACFGPIPTWDDNDPECQLGIETQGYRGRKRPDEKNWVGMGYAPGQGMGGSTGSFSILGKRVANPTEHEIAVSILRRASALGKGDLIDAQRPFRLGGLKAFDLLISCFDQKGDMFEYKDKKMPWNQVVSDEWWFAMDCFGSKGFFRKGASDFLKKCNEGFGQFSPDQRAALLKAAEYYSESDSLMGNFWGVFESVGTTDISNMAKVNETVSKVMADQALRKKAGSILKSIRKAEENAIREIDVALSRER